MTVVNVTINGRKLEAQSGQTVLDVARANDIYIPTLCDHPAVQPQGSCRMCLVEIERQRGLHPACTFPVSEGMVVTTHNPKLENARRFVLEMLFSERSHYCMFCPMSGTDESTDCELQRLAYEHGLANWQYEPNTARRWPVDASRKYFVMDHSRCILCRRCIRACDEIAANHTLGVRDRGTRTMVIADCDVPFGESTCVSCGTCLAVCPTGALMDRRSAYMGHHNEVERTKTTCMGCSVGCGIDACVRDNTLLRVESDWHAANEGLLCVDGRFGVVEPATERITTPFLRVGGQLVPATWDEALGAIASRFKDAPSVAGLVSPRATNEEMAALRDFFNNSLHSHNLGLIYGELPPCDLGVSATWTDVNGADLVLVVGGEPLVEQKVLGYTIKRAADNGARLIVAGDTATELDYFATVRVPLAQLAEALAEARAAERPVVLYAAGLEPDVYAALAELPGKARYMALYRGTNTAGASRTGLTALPLAGEVLYVLAGDEQAAATGLPPAKFVVVQAAYQTAWSEAADVVLPALTWAEKSGHVVNIEGRQLPVVPCLQPAAGLQPDGAALALLAERLA